MTAAARGVQSGREQALADVLNADEEGRYEG